MKNTIVSADTVDMHRFLCDSMLGRLGKNMRIAGIDTKLSKETDAATLLKKADAEGRTVLTRKTIFLNRRETVPIFFIAANDARSQFVAVLEHFNITLDRGMLLTRCLRCNEKLIKIGKNEAYGHVPEYIFNTLDDFSSCPQCKKIYWKGTHYKNILKYVSGFKRI